MSNYIDTTATRNVDLGPCGCPGTPHDRDSADVRVMLGFGERAIFRNAGWQRSAGQFFSNEDAKAALIQLGTVRWSLTLPGGAPRPINEASVALLDEGTVNKLWVALEPAIRDAPLPNESGAPSQGGTQESASSTQTTPEPPSSTST